MLFIIIPHLIFAFKGTCYLYLVGHDIERNVRIPPASAVFFFNHSSLEITIDTGSSIEGPYFGEEIIGLYYPEDEITLQVTTKSSEPVLLIYSVSQFDLEDCVPYVTNDASFSNINRNQVTENCLLSATCEGFVSGYNPYTTANTPAYIQGSDFNKELKYVGTNFTHQRVKNYFFEGGLENLKTHIITGKSNVARNEMKKEIITLLIVAIVGIISLVIGWAYNGCSSDNEGQNSDTNEGQNSRKELEDVPSEETDDDFADNETMTNENLLKNLV